MVERFLVHAGSQGILVVFRVAGHSQYLSGINIHDNRRAAGKAPFIRQRFNGFMQHFRHFGVDGERDDFAVQRTLDDTFGSDLARDVGFLQFETVSAFELIVIGALDSVTRPIIFFKIEAGAVDLGIFEVADHVREPFHRSVEAGSEVAAGILDGVAGELQTVSVFDNASVGENESLLEPVVVGNLGVDFAVHDGKKPEFSGKRDDQASQEYFKHGESLSAHRALNPSLKSMFFETGQVG